MDNPNYDPLISYLNGTTKMTRTKRMNDIRIVLYMWIMLLANKRFQWKGLPKEIPEYKVEQGLFLYGNLCAFKTAGVPFVMPCAMSKGLNAYNQYVSVIPYGFNGTQFPEQQVESDFQVVGDKVTTTERNAVLIRNNELMIPTFALIQPYMERLQFIWESLGFNEVMSRTLGLIVASDKTSSEAIMKQLSALFENKSPFAVVGDKKFTNLKQGGMLDKTTWDVKYNPKDYWADYYNTLSAILTIVGITNSSENDKKERNTVAEVNKNDAVTQISEAVSLAPRQDAVELMKTTLGWSGVSVEEREVSIDYETMKTALNGGDGNAQNGGSNPIAKTSTPTPDKTGTDKKK